MPLNRLTGAVTRRGVFMALLGLVLTGCQHGAPDSSASPTLQVLGTEPFWSLDLHGDTGRFSTPEHPEGTPFHFHGPVQHGARSGIDNQQVPVHLHLAQQPCSDGMSDRVYPLTARLQYGTQVYRGCARSRP